MAITAENLASKYDVSREDCDEFAFESQRRWRLADENDVFAAELAPVEIKTKKGVKAIAKDEHPREASMEGLLKLKPVFKKDGVVTAGNASGICDGREFP